MAQAYTHKPDKQKGLIYWPIPDGKFLGFSFGDTYHNLTTVTIQLRCRRPTCFAERKLWLFYIPGYVG